jgi:hypothetical protein
VALVALVLPAVTTPLLFLAIQEQHHQFLEQRLQRRVAAVVRLRPILRLEVQALVVKDHALVEVAELAGLAVL